MEQPSGLNVLDWHIHSRVSRQPEHMQHKKPSQSHKCGIAFLQKNAELRAVEVTKSISVWLVDDEHDFRETMAAGLSMEKGLGVRSFDCSETAFRELSHGSAPPDLILLDVRMPGIGGLRSIPRFKQLAPTAKVLMLTMSDSREDIEVSMQAGAFSYIRKTAGLNETVTAIRKAISGYRHLDQASLSTVLSGFESRRSKPSGISLTLREQEVLRLLDAGLGRETIAMRLRIGEGTVVTHLKSLYAKLGVHKVTEALRRAREEGLI